MSNPIELAIQRLETFMEYNVVFKELRKILPPLPLGEVADITAGPPNPFDFLKKLLPEFPFPKTETFGAASVQDESLEKFGSGAVSIQDESLEKF